MLLKEIVELLKLKTFLPEQNLAIKAQGVICGDMLSYILGNGQESNLWLTIQAHQNIIAIASLLNLSAIIITDNIQPPAATIAKAQQEHIVLLGTVSKTYELAGKLYTLKL